jgi:hypothetical protein
MAKQGEYALTHQPSNNTELVLLNAFVDQQVSDNLLRHKMGMFELLQSNGLIARSIGEQRFLSRKTYHRELRTPGLTNHQVYCPCTLKPRPRQEQSALTNNSIQPLWTSATVSSMESPTLLSLAWLPDWLSCEDDRATPMLRLWNRSSTDAQHGDPVLRGKPDYYLKLYTLVDSPKSPSRRNLTPQQPRACRATRIQ